MAFQLPADLDITVFRGTAPVLRFTLEDDEDITGFVGKFTVRARETSPDPPMVDKDLEIDSLLERRVKCSFTKAETLALRKGVYVCSVERTNAGTEDLWGKGPFTVEYDIKNAKGV